MKNIKSLPQNLVERYQNWRAGVFEEKSTHYSDLANYGQNPPT
jgi:carbonic anhydrase